MKPVAPPPPASCTLPWGGTIASGASVTAYQSSSVTAPAACVSGVRTCNNGTLSAPAYTNQNCVVNPPVVNGACGAGAGTTVATEPTGSSACSAGTLNSGSPADTSTLWNWTCTGSGGGTSPSCTANRPAVPTVSITASPNPAAYNSRPTLTWSSTGATNCVAGGNWNNSGTLSGSGLTNPLTAASTFTFTCSGPGGSASDFVTITVNPPASCTLPWGGTIASGASVTAYQSSSVTAPGTCTLQTRTCTNGTLSGSYTNQSCVVNPAPVVGVCSAANGTTQASEPTGSAACSSGTYTNSPADTAARWNWTCAGTPSTACFANRPAALSFSVNPTTLNYGTVAVLGNRTLPVTITNTGGGPITGNITLPNVAPSVYECVTTTGVLTSCGFTLNANGNFVTKNIRLRVNAPVVTLTGTARVNVVGLPSQNVSLIANGGVQTELEVKDLSASHTVTPADAAPYPISISGGTISQTDPIAVYDFQITNIGAPGMNYTVSIVGGTAPGYSIDNSLGGCSGTNVAGAPRFCRILFTPASAGAPGPKNATIRFDNTTPGAGTIRGMDPVNVSFTTQLVSGPSVEVYWGGSRMLIGQDLDFGSVPIGTAPTRQIVLRNSGDQPLTVSYPGISTTDFSAPAQNTAVTILPNRTRPINVTFTSQLPQGAKSAGMTVTSTDYPSGFPLNVRGTAISAPTLTVTPQGGGTVSFSAPPRNAAQAFPNQDIYSGGVTRIVRINNSGSAQTTVTPSSNNPVFSVSSAPVTVPVGGAAFIQITFDPDIVSPPTHTGTNTLVSPDYPSPFTISVWGNGIVTPAAITVSPRPLNFGRVLVSDTKQLDVTLRSNDPRAIAFSPASITGTAFTCVSANCGNTFTMNNGDVVTFTVEFRPPSTDAFTETMTFDITDPGYADLTLPVLGEGVVPVIKYKEI